MSIYSSFEYRSLVVHSRFLYSADVFLSYSSDKSRIPINSFADCYLPTWFSILMALLFPKNGEGTWSLASRFRQHETAQEVSKR